MSTSEKTYGEALLIGTGDRFVSKTGRKLKPAPRIDGSTERKTQATIKRINQWLLEQCKEEAVANSDNHNFTLLNSVDLNNLSPSDMDFLNIYLFNYEYGPQKHHKIN